MHYRGMGNGSWLSLVVFRRGQHLHLFHLCGLDKHVICSVGTELVLDNELRGDVVNELGRGGVNEAAHPNGWRSGSQKQLRGSLRCFSLSYSWGINELGRLGMLEERARTSFVPTLPTPHLSGPHIISSKRDVAAARPPWKTSLSFSCHEGHVHG